MTSEPPEGLPGEFQDSWERSLQCVPESPFRVRQLLRHLAAAEARVRELETFAAEMAEKYAAQSRALSQAAERRAELAWTKVPPIEAGWYWTRSNNEPNPTMRLCELVTTWKGEYLPVEGLDMKWIGLEWAGPVRPPSLPRPAED